MPNKSIVIAYIPAWHEGYHQFIKQYPHDLYLIGGDFIAKMPRLDRDIRAVDPDSMATMIRSLNICPRVEVLNNKVLSKLGKCIIYMPDEELSHDFAQKHCIDNDVTYVPVFLRWDKKISVTEQQIPIDRVVSTNPEDIAHMHAAANEASKSPDWWRQVGAVALTKDGKTRVAHNSPMPSHDYSLNTFGDPRSNFDAGEHIDLSKCIHAEAKLIAEAAHDGISLQGSTLYVTTYPCPPCAKSVALAGFTAVYYRDGYSLLDAEDILKAYNVDIVLVKSV